MVPCDRRKLKARVFDPFADNGPNPAHIMRPDASSPISWDVLRLPIAPSNAPLEEQRLLDFVQGRFLSTDVTEKMEAFCRAHVDEVDLSTEEHSLSSTALHERFLTEVCEPCLETAVAAFGARPSDFVAAARRSEGKTDDILLRVLRETISFEQFAGLLRRVALKVRGEERRRRGK
jgi:hypothetical protein